MKCWPQLFKSWITLSSGQIAIQWISVDKTNHAIRWMVICPVDSVIHLIRTTRAFMFICVADAFENLKIPKKEKEDD